MLIDKEKLLGKEPVFLQTDRCTIRMPEEKDRASYHRSLQDVSQDTKDWRKQASWEDLQADLNNENVITFFIYDNNTGHYMGYCQYNELFLDTPGLGIELLPEYQRLGFGYDICRNLIDRMFSRTDITEMHYKVRSSNCASIRLAEKLGGTFCRSYNLLETARKALEKLQGVKFEQARELLRQILEEDDEYRLNTIEVYKIRKAPVG